MGELSDIESDLTDLSSSSSEGEEEYQLDDDASYIGDSDADSGTYRPSKTRAGATALSQRAVRGAARGGRGAGRGRGASSSARGAAGGSASASAGRGGKSTAKRGRPSATAARKKRGEYVLANTLDPYRTTTYTAKALYDQIHMNTIDLDPEYQRDIVWPEAKQTNLIDSILRNYYMPPIIFAVSREDDGTERRTCIDGKQRLTSIQKFMDGLIPHKDSVTNRRFWYKSNVSKNTPLPHYLTQQFALKQIVCVEYSEISDDQEREIFQRVQLGVALTPAERMQALTGPWPTFIREIKDFLEGRDGFNGKLEWSESRGRMFQCLCMVVNILSTGTALSDEKWPSTLQLEKWLSHNEDGPTDKFRRSILDAFRVFVFLVRNERYRAPFLVNAKAAKARTFSPMEFIMVGLLIYEQMKTLNAMQLSNAVLRMRSQVRGQHDDIRMNTKVARTMMQFVKRVKAADLPGKDDSEVTAVKAAKAWGEEKVRKLAEAEAEKAKERAKAKKKRKRVETESESVEEVEDEEESDEDDIPLSKRRSPPKKPTAVSTNARTVASAVKKRAKTSTSASQSRDPTPPPAPPPQAKKTSSKAAVASISSKSSARPRPGGDDDATRKATASKPRPSTTSTTANAPLLKPKPEPMDVDLPPASAATATPRLRKVGSSSRLSAIQSAKREDLSVTIPPATSSSQRGPPPPLAPAGSNSAASVSHSYAPGDPRARRASLVLSATQSPATDPPPTPMVPPVNANGLPGVTSLVNGGVPIPASGGGVILQPPMSMEQLAVLMQDDRFKAMLAHASANPNMSPALGTSLAKGTEMTNGHSAAPIWPAHPPHPSSTFSSSYQTTSKPPSAPSSTLAHPPPSQPRSMGPPHAASQNGQGWGASASPISPTGWPSSTGALGGYPLHTLPGATASYSSIVSPGSAARHQSPEHLPPSLSRDRSGRGREGGYDRPRGPGLGSLDLRDRDRSRDHDRERDREREARRPGSRFDDRPPDRPSHNEATYRRDRDGGYPPRDSGWRRY